MRDAFEHWPVQSQCHALGRSHHGRGRRAGDRPVVMGLIQDAGSVLLGAATCPAGLGRVGAMRRRAFGLRPVPSLPSRPFGFNPSRLRACGAARWRLPSRDRSKAHPRRVALGAPAKEPNRQRRIGQAGAQPQWTRRGRYAVVCCGRLCRCVPSSTLLVLAPHVTKDGSLTQRPALQWSLHTTPQT